jgi:hypothetical protein
VTAFVDHVLAARVWAIEAAVAMANRQVRAHCSTSQPVMLLECTYLATTHPAAGTSGDTLALVLSGQARVLLAASADVGTLFTPALERQLALQMAHLLEDVVLFADQLTRLFQETATGVAVPADVPALNVASVDYGPRLYSLLPVLRRAEGWLETLDHETGAHATLPGFEPGAPTLESRLAMQ